MIRGINAFKKMGNPEAYDLYDMELKLGIVTYTEEYSNSCGVFFSKTDTDVQAYYGIWTGGKTDYQQDKGNANAWGLFAPPTENSIVIVAMSAVRNYIVLCLPPLDVPQGTFEKWREEVQLNINRLPIKDSEKRLDAVTTKNNEDLVKKGEFFLRSSGLADLLLDYLGRILFDTEKQFTVRIGDRDEDDGNKITTVESQLDIGRVVDSSGDEEVDGDGKKIKLKYSLNGKVDIKVNEDGQVSIENSNTALTIKPDGTIELGETALEKIIKGETFKTFFNAHIHPTPTGPSSPPTVAMSDAQLSSKNKVS